MRTIQESLSNWNKVSATMHIHWSDNLVFGRLQEYSIVNCQAL